MSNNKIAKKLKNTGDVMAVLCFFSALIILASDNKADLGPLFFGLIITALIGRLFLFAFAEVIILLQKNADKQDEVLYYLKAIALKENAPPPNSNLSVAETF